MFTLEEDKDKAAAGLTQLEHVDEALATDQGGGGEGASTDPL